MTSSNSLVESPLPSQEILARKWDRFLSQVTIQTGLGAAFGIGASVLFFKRRVWPIAYGAGFGSGAAYTEFQR